QRRRPGLLPLPRGRPPRQPHQRAVHATRERQRRGTRQRLRCELPHARSERPPPSGSGRGPLRARSQPRVRLQGEPSGNSRPPQDARHHRRRGPRGGARDQRRGVEEGQGQEEEQRQLRAPWRLRYRDLGSNDIGAVAHALEDQRVDMMDATYLLNARLPMVEQLLSEYYRAGGADLPTPWTATSSSGSCTVILATSSRASGTASRSPSPAARAASAKRCIERSTGSGTTCTNGPRSFPGSSARRTAKNLRP